VVGVCREESVEEVGDAADFEEADDGEEDQADEHEGALEDVGPDDGDEASFGDVEEDDEKADGGAEIVVD
jgi:hypothetical protein